MQHSVTGDSEAIRASATEYIRFTATLLPHRSLSRKGFLILMIAIGSVSVIGGAMFVSMGAWPVTGFFGLAAVLCYACFRWNYRAARLAEKIDLAEKELRVTRLHPSGKSESWSFNPYWVRFQHERRDFAAADRIVADPGDHQ